MDLRQFLTSNNFQDRTGRQPPSEQEMVLRHKYGEDQGLRPDEEELFRRNPGMTMNDLMLIHELKMRMQSGEPLGPLDPKGYDKSQHLERVWEKTFRKKGIK